MSNVIGVSVMTLENQMVAVVPVTGMDSVESSKPWFYRKVLKRPLDILLVLLGAPIVLPLIIVLAILVLPNP